MVPETTDPFVDCAAACTVATVPEGDTSKAVASPAAFTLTKLEFDVMLQVDFPVKFLVLPSSKTPVAWSWTVFPMFTRLVDCSVETVMLVRVGSTKNPWQPTPTAASKRTLNDATS